MPDLEERLVVGDYEITRYGSDYWIANKKDGHVGEGMQVFEEAFVKLIDELFKSEF